MRNYMCVHKFATYAHTAMCVPLDRIAQLIWKNLEKLSQKCPQATH